MMRFKSLWTGGLVGFDRIPCFSGILEFVETCRWKYLCPMTVMQLAPFATRSPPPETACEPKVMDSIIGRIQTREIEYKQRKDRDKRSLGPHGIQWSGVLLFSKSPNQGPEA